MNKHVGASLRKYCAPSRIADIFLKKKIYIYIFNYVICISTLKSFFSCIIKVA